MIVGLRELFLACAVSLVSLAAAESLLAQQSEAARPDKGAPPQPRDTSADERLVRIAALFAERCLACHGSEKQEGNYSVASFDALRKAGDSEETPVVAGKPEASELYRRLVTSDAAERMPAESEALSSEELELVQAWIAAGAKGPDELRAKPMGQWPRVRAPVKIPEHYPAPLPIAALALHPKNSAVFTSGYGEVLEWNLESGELLRRRPVAGAQIADIETSRDGRYLAVASGSPGTQGFVEILALSASADRPPVWSHASGDIAADIAFAPDTRSLAIGQADGSMLLVDVRELGSDHSPNVQSFTPHADAVLCVAWSESGDRLITGSRDRTAKLFDGRSMELIANYDKHERAVGGVAYSGSHPVSFDETGRLRLWTGDDSDRTVAEQGNLPRFLEHIVASEQRIYLADGADVRNLSVQKNRTEDGKDSSGKPKTKTTTRLREESRLKSGGRGWIMSLSLAGDTLAAGTDVGEVIVWKNDDPAPKFRFTAKP